MSRLITLSFRGSLESDLQVTISVGEEKSTPSSQSKGTLPGHSELTEYYLEWRNSYRSLERQTRAIQAKAARVDGTAASLRQACKEASTRLQTEINTWLSNSGFNPIRRKLYKGLATDDDTRLLIQTDDPQLWLLPWHLWTDLEEYPDLEIGFSKSSYDTATPVVRAELQDVRILAIFGDDEGIDTGMDEAALKALPSASVEILRQPTPQMFAEYLWEQSWDILFFAGHSRTTDTTGYLQLNRTDSLSLKELKHSLRKAIGQGLQLAIFNSCDGLGLAWELEELNIPQMVLMRELVPDVVAQKFLQYFLSNFSQGETLYISVRHARDRLESLENKYPCATWLPVICQNPAFTPPTWHVKKPEQGQMSQELSITCKVLRSVGMGVLTTGLILGARYGGLLQSLELWTYDLMQSSLVTSDRTSDILVVAITEDDLSIPIQRDRVDSLSPRALNRLLTILNRAGASVIGLNIFRDRQFIPESENRVSLSDTSEDLSHWADTDSPLVSICQVKDAASGKPEVKPPQNFPLDAVGFSDVVIDSDEVIRRHLIAMQPEAGQCAPYYSLGFQLALRHLTHQDENQNWFEFTSADTVRLGKTQISTLKARQGAYQSVDARGLQILLQYRKTRTSSFADAFEIVTLSKILAGEVSNQAIRDKVVLIGTTASSYKDHHKTPSGDVAGVVLQAHMANQLIELAIGEQSLVKFWPFWIDSFWILGWSVAGFTLSSLMSKTLPRFGLFFIGNLIVIFCAYSLLLFLDIWAPIVPSMMGLLLSFKWYNKPEIK